MSKNRFTSVRVIEGKLRKIIVDKNGDIINRNPSKEELVGIEKERYKLSRKERYTNEELLGYLRQFYKENGRVPKKLDFNNNPKYPNYSTYFKYFGSWNKSIELTGLWDERDLSRYTNEELLGYLRQFYKENGRVPIVADFDNNPKCPGPKIYWTRFGSWDNALDIIGLLDKRKRETYTNEELLGYLRQFYKENGRTPEINDFNNNDRYPSDVPYKKRFGSWNNAIKTAGLQVNRFNNITDEELLECLLQFYEENGKSPTIKDFYHNPRYPSFRTYTNRFGSWKDALDFAGLDASIIYKSTVEKGRQAELYVLENYEKGSRDLSGESWLSHFDGISKESKEIYDVKGSKLYKDKFFLFHLDKCADSYYLIGYDRNYDNVLYKWKIPGNFYYGLMMVGLSNIYQYNLENMKEYEIT